MGGDLCGWCRMGHGGRELIYTADGVEIKRAIGFIPGWIRVKESNSTPAGLVSGVEIGVDSLDIPIEEGAAVSSRLEKREAQSEN